MNSTYPNRGIFPSREARTILFVVGMLELAASERPDLLGPLIKALKHSPVSRGIAEIAEVWGIPPENRASDLEALAVKASRHLDRLERRRTGWRHPGQVVNAPNVSAIASFANVASWPLPGRFDRR